MRWKSPVDLDENFMIHEHKSQAGQDLFVTAVMQGRKGGTWLELGCCTPDFHNNTWLLEKHLDWSGISIDISAEGYGVPNTWELFRPQGTLVIGDACLIDYTQFPSYFDYLQVDIATPLQNFQALERVLKTQNFSVITYEHDAFSCGDGQRSRTLSRSLLYDHGYELLIPNVCLPHDVRDAMGMQNEMIDFEDWWVHPDKVPQHVRDAYRWSGPENQPKFFTELLFNHLS